MKPSLKFEIPDGEKLYRYYSPNALPEGQTEVPTGIFKDIELSCDWAKYRINPSTSYHYKEEGLTAVVEITVCEEIRNPTHPTKGRGKPVQEWHQDIIHDPVSEMQDPQHGANDAHSLIKGRKKIVICEAIASNSRWLKEDDPALNVIDIPPEKEI